MSSRQYNKKRDRMNKDTNPKKEKCGISVNAQEMVGASPFFQGYASECLLETESALDGKYGG